MNIRRTRRLRYAAALRNLSPLQINLILRLILLVAIIACAHAYVYYHPDPTPVASPRYDLNLTIYDGRGRDNVYTIDHDLSLADCNDSLRHLSDSTFTAYDCEIPDALILP